MAGPSEKTNIYPQTTAEPNTGFAVVREGRSGPYRVVLADKSLRLTVANPETSDRMDLGEVPIKALAPKLARQFQSFFLAYGFDWAAEDAVARHREWRSPLGETALQSFLRCRAEFDRLHGLKTPFVALHERVGFLQDRSGAGDQSRYGDQIAVGHTVESTLGLPTAVLSVEEQDGTGIFVIKTDDGHTFRRARNEKIILSHPEAAVVYGGNGSRIGQLVPTKSLRSGDAIHFRCSGQDLDSYGDNEQLWSQPTVLVFGVVAPLLKPGNLHVPLESSVIQDANGREIVQDWTTGKRSGVKLPNVVLALDFGSRLDRRTEPKVIRDLRPRDVWINGSDEIEVYFSDYAGLSEWTIRGRVLNSSGPLQLTEHKLPSDYPIHRIDRAARLPEASVEFRRFTASLPHDSVALPMEIA